MLVILYQFGADLTAMFEIYETYLYSTINESSSHQKKEEVMRRLTEVSDLHAGSLLHDRVLFSSSRARRSTTRLVYTRARENVQVMSTSHHRTEFRTRLEQFDTCQRPVFDKILDSMKIRQADETTTSNGKLFFLEGSAGFGNRYTLQLLQQYAESKSKEHIFLITAVTGIAVSLYENGRVLPSILELRVDDKGSSKPTASSCSMYGPRSKRTRLLCKSSLITIDEASVMERRLFKRMDVVLKYLRCQSSESSRPMFGGICMACSGDFSQLSPVVNSRKWVEDEHGWMLR